MKKGREEKGRKGGIGNGEEDGDRRVQLIGPGTSCPSSSTLDSWESRPPQASSAASSFCYDPPLLLHSETFSRHSIPRSLPHPCRSIDLECRSRFTRRETWIERWGGSRLLRTRESWLWIFVSSRWTMGLTKFERKGRKKTGRTKCVIRMIERKVKE